MKKVILAILLGLLLVAVVITPSLAGRASFVELDYDGDGVVDCQYTVSSKCGKKASCVSVSYFSLDFDYLGQEMWTEYWGLMVDTFEPWTYPFPEC